MGKKERGLGWVGLAKQEKGEGDEGRWRERRRVGRERHLGKKENELGFTILLGLCAVADPEKFSFGGDM